MVRGRARPLLAEVVRADLRQAILEGEFPVGSKLPNEEQLCERFSVSRVTIREAVRGLIEDGFVVRRQGSGTYVTRRPLLRNSLDVNFSYTEYLASAGVSAGRSVLSTKAIPADSQTAEDLAITEGTEVVEIRRIRTADDRPAIYSIDVIPRSILDGTADALDEASGALDGSLYEFLTSAGHSVAHAEAVVSPAIADRKVARTLDVPPGTPLQHLRQVDYDGEGRPVMLSREWHVPSVIQLRVYRRGPGEVG